MTAKATGKSNTAKATNTKGNIKHNTKRIRRNKELDSLNMIQTQEERKAPPSDDDYEELRELLWDFNITVDIPVFSSRMEMDRWRHRILIG